MHKNENSDQPDHASAKSDQSLRCPNEETSHSPLHVSEIHQMKIPIRLRICAGWSESSTYTFEGKFQTLRLTCSWNSISRVDRKTVASQMVVFSNT